jgi:hypothetical protein
LITRTRKLRKVIKKKIKINSVNFIDEENFVGWFRWVLTFFGIAILLAGFASNFLPGWIRFILFSVGFALAAIGGYSSPAHILKIKFFDNSYKNARKSYDEDEK